jgi:hypothetical protein
MRAGIWATGSTKSTRPVAIELRGMSSYSASFGSCAMASPPYSLMRFSPADPFGPVPDSTTATACDPCASASARKKTSTGERRCSTRVISLRISVSPLISRLLLGDTTYT